MAEHGNSLRRRTGGRIRPRRKRRKHEIGSSPTETEVGAPRLKTIDVQGDRRKVRALATNEAIVADGGETVVTTIENVVENQANPNYVRRNIVTKGAIIDTPEGQARVTSRPGQDGHVCAVLIE